MLQYIVQMLQTLAIAKINQLELYLLSNGMD